MRPAADTRDVAKHLIDVDEARLAAARTELGTTTLKDAVNEATHVHRALQVQRLLMSARQSGRKGPDLLIAAAAESMHLEMLHDNTEFDLIAAVTGQRCAWVLPAGTVA